MIHQNYHFGHRILSLHNSFKLIVLFHNCPLFFRIVLEAGYFLQDRAFFDNIGTILLYAVVVCLGLIILP